MTRGTLIGIDFGTSKSSVAVVEQGSPRIIPNSRGHSAMPSMVSVSRDGTFSIGWEASNRRVTSAGSSEVYTIGSIKRLMGRTGEADWGFLRTVPQEISALILGRLRIQAEEQCGPISGAVIAVPAQFDINQREAIGQAAQIAGIDVVRMIHEPTAAALGYASLRNAEEKIAVFDFGAGTFDVSVLSIGKDVYEVLSTYGDPQLGGDDIDDVIVNYLAEQFLEIEETDLLHDPMSLERLKEASEKAKRELSQCMETVVELPFIAADDSGPKHLKIPVTRHTLESRADYIFDKLKVACKKVIDDLKGCPVDKVLLVGGSTRIPKVQQIVRECFHRVPDKSLNPDEAVALGAAIQAAILEGNSHYRDILLLDVCPTSLSLGTEGDLAECFIARNTTIPTSKKKVFTTIADSLTDITLQIYEGESERASENEWIGQLRLSNLPPASKGMPQIEVTFDIDLSGWLSVTAKDLGTNYQTSAVIEAPHRLNPAQIDLMKKRTASVLEEYADRAKRAEVERFADLLDSFIGSYGYRLSEYQLSLLEKGRGLMIEHITRQTPTEELERMAKYVHHAHEQAVTQIRSEALHAIEDPDSTTHSQAIKDLRRLGVGSFVGELAKCLRLDLPREVKMDLIALIEPSPCEDAIFSLLEKLGAKDMIVKQTVINILCSPPWKKMMDTTTTRFTEIARRAILEKCRPRLGERLFLRSFVSKHKNLAEVVSTLQASGG